ncbi:multiubiquitin domain-containing protein [Bradyrhizobium sp. CCBAU 53380]|uniref:multiubiquitin domain-containing protein n=1 Tax=Bradyrhizobium sp. CCBAU 53380 TaxID=1325117 RepID=UPI002303B01D|nr:multiubiquitin domain-containing protein [Bradyrhizobium sp. CCBAU 53380]
MPQGRRSCKEKTTMEVHEIPPDHAGKHYFYTIDGNRLETSDEIQDARKLLQKAGIAPADDYVLIELLRPGTRIIGLDEDVDLDGTKTREFRSFLTDRTFNFTVDEVGYAWGRAAITEPELRDVAEVPASKVIFLDRHDQEDLVLEESSSVDLDAAGTEHLRTAKRLITVFYKDKPFELEPGKYTGAQLAAIFGVPSQYQLDLVKPNGEFEEIEPAKSVKITDGMHFVSHPPCGQSS